MPGKSRLRGGLLPGGSTPEGASAPLPPAGPAVFGGGGMKGPMKPSKSYGKKVKRKKF